MQNILLVGVDPALIDARIMSRAARGRSSPTTSVVDRWAMAIHLKSAGIVRGSIDLSIASSRRRLLPPQQPRRSLAVGSRLNGARKTLIHGWVPSGITTWMKTAELTWKINGQWPSEVDRTHHHAECSAGGFVADCLSDKPETIYYRP